ncbi:MAG: hypothetical protein GY807_21015 [Gammaproteobacteria bacterium]|nr:hypothetical protein [Gammaproteobacteria bacterium]
MFGSVFGSIVQRRCECAAEKAMQEVRQQHNQAMIEFYLRRDLLHKKLIAAGGPNWHMRHVPLIVLDNRLQ